MQLLQKSTYSQTHDIDADPVKHLESSTKEYLHMSFLLWEYKNFYNKKEYRELLKEYCWDKGSAEEKRALKLAEHYQDFAHRPQALTQIPVTKLLKLCSDKNKSIIEELKQFDDEDITCDRVFNLIKQKQAQLKKEKESQLPEKPSIWRRNCRQERYVAFPPLYEDDQQTGILTQKLMDEYGLIPQHILRQAIGDFYEKITEGQQEGNTAQNVDGISEPRENSCSDNYSLHGVTVNQTVDDVAAVNETVTVGDVAAVNQTVDDVAAVNEAVTVDDVETFNQAVGDLEFVNQTVEDKWQRLNEQLNADIDSIGKVSKETGQLIFENCQQWETAVPANQKWNAIANICGRDEKLLNYLSNYAYANHSEWVITWGEILASYEGLEQELEWIDGSTRIGALVEMGFKISSIVEVTRCEYEGMHGRIIDISSSQEKPILVKFDNFQEYFHWSELRILTEEETFAYYNRVEDLQEEESDIELTQNLLDKAIDTLIHGNWECIRDLFNQYPEIKEQAWNALSSEQKRRVVDITPEMVKVLNQAKKEGVIAEYKEIAVGVYRVKLSGKLLWEQRAFHEIEICYYLRAWREAMVKK